MTRRHLLALALAIATPAHAEDARLRAMLPKAILDAGEIVSVNSGSFPPYSIIGDKREVLGATGDIQSALGELFGVRFRDETVSGLASVLSGIRSGRYQISMGPNGDFPDRELGSDFVDWVREFVVFAVPRGNPKNIRSLDDACGKRIAVASGGSAEQVIQTQSKTCVAAGRPAIEVQSFTDQPTSMLAVRSNRSDAFFSSQAPLTYFVGQANGQLELAATGQSNGFDNLFQGAVVPKGSSLGPAILEGFRTLFSNGTYAAIMKKWGLEANMLREPGLNLSASK